LTGRDVGAEEAVALGWLDGVVPSDQLLAYVRGLARRMAAMPAGSISAVKRVVDRSLGSIDEALIAETDALGALMAAGGHVAPMKRFLEAGGQSRVGESSGMAPIVDAMVQGA
jgi:enoyl-CoA hydratase/carnithine racemase